VPTLRGRAIFFLAKLVPGILGLGTTAMLTRWVEPAQYGVYAFGLSIILFAVGAGFGWLNLSLLRLRPSFPQPRALFGTLIVVFCALSAGIAALVGIGTAVIESWHYAPFLAACLLSTFATAWFEMTQRVQLSELQGGPYFGINVVRAVLILLLTFAAAYLRLGATAMILAVGISTLVAVSLFRIAHLNLLNWCFDRAIGRTVLQFGLPVFVGFGVANILISIDRWMLQLLSDSQAVGLFSAASFVTQVPVALLAGGIGPSAYALAVRAYEFSDPATVKAQLEENLVILLGIVLPAAAGIAALSRNLAYVTVGESFAPAVIELAPYLCVASALWAVRANYVDSAFHIARNTRPLITIMSVTLAANVAIDFWLIPWKGELGAAIGSCIALAAGFVVAVIASRRVYKLPLPFKETAKVAAATAIMYAALQTVSDFRGVGVLLAQITIGSLVYLAAIAAMDVLHARRFLVRQLTGWLAQRGMPS